MHAPIAAIAKRLLVSTPISPWKARPIQTGEQMQSCLEYEGGVSISSVGPSAEGHMNTTPAAIGNGCPRAARCNHTTIVARSGESTYCDGVRCNCQRRQ